MHNDGEVVYVCSTTCFISTKFHWNLVLESMFEVVGWICFVLYWSNCMNAMLSRAGSCMSVVPYFISTKFHWYLSLEFALKFVSENVGQCWVNIINATSCRAYFSPNMVFSCHSSFRQCCIHVTHLLSGISPSILIWSHKVKTQSHLTCTTSNYVELNPSFQHLSM